MMIQYYVMVFAYMYVPVLLYVSYNNYNLVFFAKLIVLISQANETMENKNRLNVLESSSD